MEHTDPSTVHVFLVCVGIATAILVGLIIVSFLVNYQSKKDNRRRQRQNSDYNDDDSVLPDTDFDGVPDVVESISDAFDND